MPRTPKGTRRVAAPSRRSVEERNALVVANRGLVSVVLRKLHPDQLARLGGWDDAFQIGLLGLIRAAELYDETRGIEFTTYAVHGIARHVYNDAATAGLIRTPRGSRHDPRYKDAARLTDYVAGGLGTRFDSPSDGGDSLFDLPDDAQGPADEAAQEDEARAARYEARRLLPSLDATTRHCVVQCVMLGRTLAEVGSELGVNREAVRQRVAAGLFRLRRRAGLAAQGVERCT